MNPKQLARTELLDELGDELAARLRARGRAVIRSGVDPFHHPAKHRHRRGRESAEGYYRAERASVVVEHSDFLNPRIVRRR